MSEAPAKFSKGLEGVIADESAIGLVDGTNGRLYYRGFPIEELVAKKSFDETAHMLLFDAFPNAEELARFRSTLALLHLPPPFVFDVARKLPKTVHPMEALQALVALIGGLRPGELGIRRVTGPDGVKRSEIEPWERLTAEVLAVLAQIPTIVAAFHRARADLPFPEPRDDLSFFSNFLYLFHGRAPEEEDVRVFEVCEMLQMEHGFNASTFTARVVASTLASPHTSLSSAIGALCGILHGGADQAAFLMARDEVRTPDAAPAYVAKTLASGGRIMGVGHREYKTLDPRARILKGMAAELAHRKGGDKKLVFDTLVAIEKAAVREFEQRGQSVHANVEFYKGAVFHALDIPPDHFTAMFAIARAFGWAAHLLELAKDQRIYRPTSLFSGTVPRSVD
ncbi:MAG TPA: citrate/2-methylcitrate synthase [Polyangiaceae bacterium]